MTPTQTQHVSVVVPAYNNEATIQDTLSSLKNQDFDGEVEVIVIDDRSTDATADVCQKFGVKVFRNDSNIGLAGSLNRGIKLAENDLIVTLHADAIPLSNRWLAGLIVPVFDPGIGAVCSLQHAPNCDSNISLWERMLWGRVKPHYALNNKADLYRKDILSKIGGFDERRFRTAGEDEDLALRLRLNGLRVVGSDAEILHNHTFGSRKPSVLWKILQKEWSFGRAGGALRRKFPKHKPGAYVYPSPGSFFGDGLFRVSLCLGCLIPFVQLVCLPTLLLVSLRGLKGQARSLGFQGSIAYPFFQMGRIWTYTFGYLQGIMSGVQR